MLNTSPIGSTSGATITGGLIELERLPLEYSPAFVNILEQAKALTHKFAASLDELPPVQALPDCATLETFASAIVDLLQIELYRLLPVLKEFRKNGVDAMQDRPIP